MSDVILRAEHLAKRFWIPLRERSSLREYVTQPFSRTQYRELVALEGVSFDVPRGEWLGVIGLNGSGKSTLLKIFAGVYRPTAGVVRIHGKVVPILELGIGFHPDLSVRDNIFLSGVIMGLSRKEVRERFLRIVEFAEVEPFLAAKLKTLSSGFQARLAFSIAAQVDGDCYLLDEVFGIGDIEFQQKAAGVIRELKKKGRSALLVSHNLAMIERFSDRVLYLLEGRVVGLGAPRAVLEQYQEESTT